MSASSSLLQRRILLIDDDELIAGSLQQYLTANGGHVDVALEPGVAEKLMGLKAYDVVVVDPYLTGAVHRDNNELLDRVCALQRAAAIIVLTAYTSPALERTAAECDVAALLRKPQSVVALASVLRNLPSTRIRL